jgi:hypothetical protein
MLVEIAASRCPPARGVLRKAGCASTQSLLVRQGSRCPARPFGNCCSCTPSLGSQTSQPCRVEGVVQARPAVKRAGLVQQIVGLSGICQSEATPGGAYVRYDRKHSDPTRTATGSAWHCTSESGASSPSLAGCHGSDPYGWFLDQGVQGCTDQGWLVPALLRVLDRSAVLRLSPKGPNPTAWVPCSPWS